MLAAHHSPRGCLLVDDILLCVCMLARKRKDYVSQLTKDLCLYYDYNEYLMTKVMQLFPLDEVSIFVDFRMLWFSVSILSVFEML